MSFTRHLDNGSDLDTLRARAGRFLDKVDTPAAVVATYMGNLLYCTPSLAEDQLSANSCSENINNSILGQIELADVVSLEEGVVEIGYYSILSATYVKWSVAVESYHEILSELLNRML